MFHWTLHRTGASVPDIHAAVAVGHKMFCFGGLKRRRSGRYPVLEVHVFNTVSLRWATTPGRTTFSHLPCGYTAALVERVVYVWGGSPRRTPPGQLQAFDVDARAWLRGLGVSGSVPENRFNHSACVLGKDMFIYGGNLAGSRCLGRQGDIYKLDTRTMVWSLLITRGTPPPPTQCPSATVIGTKMFVFGGSLSPWDTGYSNDLSVFDTETNLWLSGTPSDRGYSNDLSVFDTETNLWLSGTPSAQPLPRGRWSHSAFAYNGELHVIGGCIYGQSFNDLWRFSPETSSWKEVKPRGQTPPYGNMECMGCCMVGDRFVIFGSSLHVLDFSPSLKTLCKLAVIQYDLEQSGLPHNVRWELAAMTTTDPKKRRNVDVSLLGRALKRILLRLGS